MSDNILEDIKDIFKITQDITYDFKTLYGFTIVFKTNITSVGGKISSAEIQPVGIIYEENDQYYFAPLDKAENITEIVKEFVENI